LYPEGLSPEELPSAESFVQLFRRSVEGFSQAANLLRQEGASVDAGEGSRRPPGAHSFYAIEDAVEACDAEDQAILGTVLSPGRDRTAPSWPID